MRTRGFIASVLGISAVFSLVDTSASAANVSVTIRLHLRSRTDSRPACTVSVPARSSAIAVLNAAVDATTRHEKKCSIHSFSLGRDDYFRKNYVECVNHLCDLHSIYWFQFENGKEEGFVEDFSADGGDDLVFMYTECFCTFPFYT